MNHYEAVFAITPILAPENASDVAAKFRKIFIDAGCKIVHEENWGLVERQAGRVPGYYRLIEFHAAADVVKTLEVSFRRDEWICHYKVVRLS